MKRRILSVLLFLSAFICIDRGMGSIINTGLERYFGLNQHSEILLIGHSHLMLAVDKEALERGTGKKVSKYCREGVNVADRYEMVKQYLSSPYSDSLKVVLYGVDQFMFTGEGLSQNSYKLFYPFMENKDIDRYIKQSTDSYDYWLHKSICTTRYSDALLNSAIRGWRKDWSNYKEGTLNVASLKNQIAKRTQRQIYFEASLIETFEATLEMLTRKNIKVVLVNTPIARILNEYEPEAYRKIIRYFEDKTTSSSLIYYWDMNPEYADKYEIFFDPIHLNPTGQEITTNRLIKNIMNLSIR